MNPLNNLPGPARPAPGRRDVHSALENDGWNCTFECEVHVSASGTPLDAEDPVGIATTPRDSP